MKTLIYALIMMIFVITGCTSKENAATGNSTEALAAETTAASDQPSFTQGLAKTINPGLLQCKGGRVSALGEIKSDDGKTWIVPSNVSTKLVDASDMSNGCNNVNSRSIADVNLDKVPLTVIDADGVEITAYIFADNYFELYVNGKAVAKDPVPFTPFNSSVVRFKAKYPITYAIKVVDWEENLGLGSEDNKGNKYHPGDAGIVISFSDGTVTDESWKAQNYYIAPLANKSDLVIAEIAGKVVRSTPTASNEPKCEAQCYAAHFAVPENWFAVQFDDSTWPAATTYEERTVGVDNKSEYTNFASEFRKGKFIWTNNLNLDNEILLRHTVEQAR
jgi:hypothetical protein